LIEVNSEFVSRQIEDELVLVPIRHNVGDLDYIYTMNRTGSFIWKLINEKKGVEEVIEAVVENFDVNHDKAMKEVNSFLKELGDIEVIKFVDK